jgi:hypothetical protein
MTHPTRTQTTPVSTGIKALLATLSLAATVSGWALLTHQATPSLTSDASLAQVNTLTLAPLPTLVAPPASMGSIVTGSNGPVTVNPAPQPPVVLRSVTRPSLPAASTRSSR